MSKADAVIVDKVGAEKIEGISNTHGLKHKVPFMSFYPDFILISSRFLSRFYLDFIQILFRFSSKFDPNLIQILFRFFRNSLYSNFIQILS
jgi:hypothetical protein